MTLNTIHIKTGLDYYWQTIDTIKNVKNNLVTWELQEWVPVSRNLAKIISEGTYP